jgi:DNA gyrase/topoisomerase IV subunit A
MYGHKKVFLTIRGKIKMELQDLFSRARDLQQQLGNDKQTLNLLSEQLEQAKASFHMTNGRIQELAHLVEQEQKLQQAKAAEEDAARLAAEQQKAVMDSSGGNDGKVIEQVPE